MTKQERRLNLDYLREFAKRSSVASDLHVTKTFPLQEVLEELELGFRPFYDVYINDDQTFVTNGKKVATVGLDISEKLYQRFVHEAEGPAGGIAFVRNQPGFEKRVTERAAQRVFEYIENPPDNRPFFVRILDFIDRQVTKKEPAVRVGP